MMECGSDEFGDDDEINEITELSDLTEDSNSNFLKNRCSKKNKDSEKFSDEVSPKKDEKKELMLITNNVLQNSHTLNILNINGVNVDKFKFVAKSADKRFGKFDQEIGFGSYKRVYRGFDFNEGREVAWNCINVSEMEENELDKIRDEINIMKKLNHPNIINYISGWFDKQKKEVVIITEIICGGSLKKHLTKIINPRLKLIKFWIKEVLRGLKYLHNEVKPPIVHRDIKCDNLYIDSTNGRIKIGDLGLSKIQSNNFTSSFAGTEEFMAPEVFQGKYSVLADIYSLGMCVLEMLTGDKPYKEYESNILKIYECSKKGILPISINRLKNDELKNFIVSCLKPESQRPSADILLELPYLNETENEENNRAIELLAENEVIIDIKNRLSNSTVCKENNDSNIETIDEKLEIIEKNQFGMNCFNSSTNLSSDGNFFNRNSVLIKEKDSPITVNSEYIIKNQSKEICINTNLFTNDTNSFPTNTYPSISSNLNSKCFSSNHINNINHFQSNKQNLNSVKDRKGIIIGTLNKNLIRQTSSNTIQNNIPYLSYDSKLHKFSLKNSLNLNQIKVNFLKFEVNIQTKLGSTANIKNISQTPILQSSQILNTEQNELEIIFIVHRGDWANGKKIKFNYDLNNDNMEDVVRELQRAIELSEVEYNIINLKLSEFITKFQNSKEIKDLNVNKDTKENGKFSNILQICDTNNNEEKCFLESTITSKSDQEYSNLMSNKPEKTKSIEINKPIQDDYVQSQKFMDSMENILSNYDNLLTKIEKLTKNEKYMIYEEMKEDNFLNQEMENFQKEYKNKINLLKFFLDMNKNLKDSPKLKNEEK